MSEDSPHKIDWLRTIAAALAAVASAFLLSTLGAAGTLIGAAVGSIVVSVVTSVFASGMARGRDRMAQAQAKAVHNLGIAQAELRRAHRRGVASEAHMEHADEMLVEAKEELSQGGAPSLKERLRAVSWPRAAAYAAGLFVVVIAVITGIELIAGEPVSSMTGGSSGPGTSITRLGGGRQHTTKTPSPAATTSATPSQGPSAGSTATTAPSSSAQPTQPAPSASTEPSGAASASGDSSPSAAPTGVDPSAAATAGQ